MKLWIIIVSFVAASSSASQFRDNGSNAVVMQNGTVSSSNFYLNTPATAIGDSMTAINPGWVADLTSVTHATITNIAQSSTSLGTIAFNQVVTLIPAVADRFFFMPGFNDMRYFGSDATAYAGYTNTLTGACLWLSIPHASKRWAYSDARLTWSANWTQTNIYTPKKLATSKVTSTIGSWMSNTISGTTIYIGYTLYPGDAGTFDVTIDGANSGPFDKSVGLVGPNTVNWWPAALRFSGLVNGPHSVIVTNLSGQTFIDFVASNTFPNRDGAAPTVYLLTTPRMETSQYAAYAPYNNGSDAIVSTYVTWSKAVGAALKDDGLDVQVIDSSLTFDPNDPAQLSGDGVHPSTTGSWAIAYKVLSVLAK